MISQKIVESACEASTGMVRLDPLFVDLELVTLRMPGRRYGAPGELRGSRQSKYINKMAFENKKREKLA